MTYNAADPKLVEKQAIDDKLEVEQYHKDLREILSRPAGVRVFKKILADGGMFTTSFTGNSTTFFNEGARNAALRIFAAICEASPDAVKSLILDDRGKNNGRE